MIDMLSQPLKRGDYQAPSSTDLRGPCPVVNCLANHGYIARDGRQVREAEIRNAMKELGVSITITTALSYGGWLEHHDVPKKGLWAFLRAPFAYLLQNFGCRDPNEVDAAGVACLDLDQLSRHGAIEHDVSLSRRDFAQGDNHTPQKDLIQDMISSSTNGKVVTTQDLAVFRLRRVQQQQHDNPKLLFEDTQNTMGCAEAAFIQKVFGDRNKDWAIPVPYLQALFGEERLPVREGWQKRSWWKVGFIELAAQTRTFMRALETLK